MPDDPVEPIFLQVTSNAEGVGEVSFNRIVDREEFAENNFFEVTFRATEEGCQVDDMICQNANATTTLRLEVNYPTEHFTILRFRLRNCAKCSVRCGRKKNGQKQTKVTVCWLGKK